LATYAAARAEARISNSFLVAIAVTLHELATNAAKYGALSATEGQIEVKWSHTADGCLILLWTETGGPPVKAPTGQGFGGKVIIEQLKGRTCFDWRPEGLVAKSLFRRENRPSRAPRSLDLHHRTTHRLIAVHEFVDAKHRFAASQSCVRSQG
jgi:two-component sensor histidine kinase